MTGFPDDKTYDGATTALQRELAALRLANDALVTECGACQTALREEEKEVARLRALVGELEDAAVWSDKRIAQLSDEEKQLAQALATADEYKRDWEACHRQHEQCMRLLEMAEPWVVATPLGKLIREMRALGELPEGWDQ